MGRLIGYMANRADRLRDALHQERSVIAPPRDTKSVGWGIGFYQGGEVLHKKRPHADGKTLEWEEIASDVKSDCAVIHVRQATVGDFRAENTHPFRMRSWLFAHNGTIDRFDAMRQRLVESMPDFLQRNIRGETDSEHFFHALAAFLHDAGYLDSPDDDDKVVLHAIRSAVTLIDSLSAEVNAKPASLNFVLTNGRRMYALRRGKPLAFVERHGLHDPLSSGNGAPKAASPVTAVRYVMTLSDGPTGAPQGWNAVEDGSVLVLQRDLSHQVHAL